MSFYKKKNNKKIYKIFEIINHYMMQSVILIVPFVYPLKN